MVCGREMGDGTAIKCSRKGMVISVCAEHAAICKGCDMLGEPGKVGRMKSPACICPMEAFYKTSE